MSTSECVNPARAHSINSHTKGDIFMARKSHHIVHNKSGGWDVKRSGSQRASAHASTKAAAERIGRQISQNQGTEFVVHGLNGRIQRSDSHGKDPCPPRDKQ